VRRLLLLVILISVAVFPGCGPGKKEIPAGFSPAPEKKSQFTRIIIAGSGSSVDLVRHLAKAFEERNGGVIIDVPDSVGSTGGIKLLKEGKIDLAMVSRPLTGDEKAGMSYKPFARSAVVFATHPTVKIKNLTTEQIIAIYNGKITNWRTVGGPDAKIVVLTRDGKASSKTLLAEKLPGFAGIKEPASSLLITSQQNMREALASVPYSIGWLDRGIYGEADLPVNVPALDGVYPGVENIEQGKYLLTRVFAFVYRGAPKKAASEFMDFVFSPLGKQEMIKQGYGLLQ